MEKPPRLMWRIGIIILLTLISFIKLQAHEVRPAYLHIKQLSQQDYEVLWKVPTAAGRELSIQPIFPEDFITNLKKEKQLPDSNIFIYQAQYPQNLAGKTISILNLEKTLVDVMILMELENDIQYSFLLHPDDPEVNIPIEPNQFRVFKAYIRLGIEHILLGYDHLLFVLVLLLLITNLSSLLWTITSFTVAHSITLCLASLQLMTLDSAPVEAVIALSIIFLAKEYLSLQNGAKSITSRYPWMVSFSFGLLHGFGFAGALSDIGFPQNQIFNALLSFNLGVELGQIIFILACLVVIKIARQIPFIRQTALLKKLLTYSIGGLASYWFIVRMISIVN